MLPLYGGLSYDFIAASVAYYKDIKKRRKTMSRDNSKKSTSNHKKEDGTFHSKHINHNPQAESARAVFGLKEDNSKR